jgi:predicted ABC-type exoprotein transport system permease subunit
MKKTFQEAILMIYKEHPKHNLIVTGIVALIGLMILFIFLLPLFNIKSDILKGAILTLFLVAAAYPIFKYRLKQKKSLSFEERHGRKLK